ncbi:hypothetical protein [Kordia sp.]|uniref:hypothetical protein n=1 Tax=Kordia sp. TaxID=1965332 RepID=UPI003B5AD1DA
MKKVIYLSAALVFSAFTLNATGEIKEDKKIDKSKEVIEIELVEDGFFFQAYRGRCLDGTTFSFEADNRDEAQAYVNGYCRGLRDAEN